MRSSKVGTTYIDRTWGYVFERVDHHPLFPGKRWVRQHRLRMAEHLGRRLRKGELVHHTDENKLHNRIKNLACTTHKKHPTLHRGAKRSAQACANLAAGAQRRAQTPKFRLLVSRRAKRQWREGNIGRKDYTVSQATREKMRQSALHRKTT